MRRAKRSSGVCGASRGTDGSSLGAVREIWSTGAHDVLVIERRDQPLLLPATDEVIVEVDRERGILVVEPPRGLLEQHSESED